MIQVVPLVLQAAVLVFQVVWVLQAVPQVLQAVVLVCQAGQAVQAGTQADQAVVLVFQADWVVQVAVRVVQVVQAGQVASALSEQPGVRQHLHGLEPFGVEWAVRAVQAEQVGLLVAH